MPKHHYFQLRRLSDDLIYHFDHKEKEHGIFAYKRRDQDLWITYHEELGWIAYDEKSKSITGRPWEIQPNQQKKNHPPAGIWVSRKGIKSYVYKLVYTDS